MRVGVYVDAFNVYYGARGQCGRGSAGWRWLDLLSLSSSLAEARFGPRAAIVGLAYCTALREKEGDPSSVRDQLVYLNALQLDGRVRVEFGQYNVKTGKGVLLAPSSARRRRYQRVISPGVAEIPAWLPAEETIGPEGDTNLFVHYSSFEEKGSDVNVATRLLTDVLERRVDAAIVVSNDGDLSLPLRVVRQHVPVGLVNPTARPLSQMLKGLPADGVGGHWWVKLGPDDYRAHQFAESVGGFDKPVGW
ncbi:NYN domain-containing protein [Microbacterium sp. NEAU-LLC]|uniref:NYN domain-containing protein n=1 Tax=Microbacterium helvum TaxID=2773713 RepID=A0ABR8NPL1_9MICO|nr:NYN domain-containing protein [Microbacterium helvum]MBD3942119.1 NYN domain-containing protein [Microbacterium helvum]